MAALEEPYKSWFVVADADKDGLIAGGEAVAFMTRSGLDKPILKRIWDYADSRQTGKLQPAEFRFAMLLVSVAQTGQPLSDDVAARLRAGIGPTPPAPRIQGLPSPAPAAPAPAPTPAPAPAAAAPAPGASGAWPPLAADEAARINSLFSSTDKDNDGKLTGQEAREIMLQANLSKEWLKAIWDLADADRDGALTRAEFTTALYFVSRAKEGRPPPASVPPGLFSSAGAPASPQPSNSRLGPTPGGVAASGPLPSDLFSGPPAGMLGPGSMAGPMPGGFRQGPGGFPGGGPGGPGGGGGFPSYMTGPAGMQMNRGPMPGGGGYPGGGPMGGMGAMPQMPPGGLGGLGGGAPPGGGGAGAAGGAPKPSGAPIVPENLLLNASRDDRERYRSLHADALAAESNLEDKRSRQEIAAAEARELNAKLRDLHLFKSRCEAQLSEVQYAAERAERDLAESRKQHEHALKAAEEAQARLQAQGERAQAAQAQKQQLLELLQRAQEAHEPPAPVEEAELQALQAQVAAAEAEKRKREERRRKKEDLSSSLARSREGGGGGPSADGYADGRGESADAPDWPVWAAGAAEWREWADFEHAGFTVCDHRTVPLPSQMLLPPGAARQQPGGFGGMGIRA